MKTLILSAMLGLAIAAPAAAQPVDLTVLHAWPHHAQWQGEIARRYMEIHPEVKITFQAPSTDYGEGLVSVIRQSLAGEAPDVFMVGSHLLRNLVARGMVEPLDDVTAGRDMAALGYTDAILKLTQVDGVQYGLPWTSSTPVMFYNRDLVAKAGGDPDAMPKTWDATIALAAKIQALGGGFTGMYYSLGDDDWMTQNLLATNGLAPIEPGGTQIAFAQEGGREALRTYRRFFDEGGQQPIADKAARQEMFAGKVGLYFNSTAAVRSFSREIGDRFAWGTAEMPVLKDGGGVASGGMAAVILTDDPAKRAAAFDYLLFGTSPDIQAYVVEQTGYMPSNAKAVATLRGFYDANPSFETSARQIGRAFPWFAWPGQNGVKISQTVLDDMTAIGNGAMTPDAAAAAMTDRIAPLLK